MNFLQWIRAMLLLRQQKGEPVSEVSALLHEAHDLLHAEEYENARGVLLRTLKFRDEFEGTATIDYVLTSLSLTWLVQERYDESISFFTQEMSNHPGNWAAYCERAAALWYSGRFQESIRDYSQALELKSNNILSLSGRGQVLAEIGQYEKAMEDLDLALQVLKTVPAFDSSWSEWYEHIKAFVRNGRGAALAGLGKNGPAMEEFEQSIALSPENAWVYYNRGQVHHIAGNHEKASSDYQMALTKSGPALTPIQKKRAQARLRDKPN